MYFRPHPNGHEGATGMDAYTLASMDIQEEDDCFVAGFLRPLQLPVARMDAQQSSNLPDEGSNPSGETT